MTEEDGVHRMTQKYMFVVIELAHDFVLGQYTDFEEARTSVESDTPSRWHNPVLLCVPHERYASYKSTGEGEAQHFFSDDNSIQSLVVAVPDDSWGYGERYRSFIQNNRERFDLVESG